MIFQGMNHVAFKRKHTHEEIFEFAFINVVWEVADKKLVAIGIPDVPPAVHVTSFSISPASCRSEKQAHQKNS